MGRRKALPPGEAPNRGARELRTALLRDRRARLAKLVGVTEWALSRYALGQRSPAPEVRSALEDVTGIESIAWDEVL